MKATLTFTKAAYDYTNVEGVMPPNTQGRFVYVHGMRSGELIYVKELEVFAPFSFGE